MKKISAILFFALFLFNLFGYRIFLNHAQQQSDVKLEAALDKSDFGEAELVKITVPLSLPYQNDQRDFERVNGELKLNGKIYKYVKRKISGGELILMCLPDHKKMELESAKDEYFKYANDIVQNKNSKKSDNSKAGFFKNLVGEYDNYTADFGTRYSSSKIVYNFSKQSHYFPYSPHSSPEQPPELI